MRKYRITLCIASAIILSACGDTVAADEPLPESSQATIGYDSVEGALAALRAKRGVTFKSINGWLVATDEEGLTVWSFAPQSDPAYPAAVERKVVPQGNGSSIEMNVHCEASKQACDNLVRTFAAMNGISLK